MLNKGICKRCWESRYREGLIYVWDKDNIWEKNREVTCPFEEISKLAYTATVSIDDVAPAWCPFSVEHLVSSVPDSEAENSQEVVE